jgi:hypothetical protein
MKRTNIRKCKKTGGEERINVSVDAIIECTRRVLPLQQLMSLDVFIHDEYAMLDLS